MAAELALSPCWMCGRIIQCNPDRVPSVTICRGCQHPPDMHAEDCPRTAETSRYPLCADCVAHANEMRERVGVPPIVTLPGAYEREIR